MFFNSLQPIQVLLVQLLFDHLCLLIISFFLLLSNILNELATELFCHAACRFGELIVAVPGQRLEGLLFDGHCVLELSYTALIKGVSEDHVGPVISSW